MYINVMGTKEFKKKNFLLFNKLFSKTFPKNVFLRTSLANLDEVPDSYCHTVVSLNIILQFLSRPMHI